ncbi:MAG TPA: transcriptional regulator [Candidatus Bathyarchaeia archaeon]|nr:transcriptional regulator [Candidatus Bathyarchaeia archaeon]
MEKDQAIGVVILAGSIIGIILYFWLVFLSPWSGFIMALTLFAAVAALLAILGWIGWTMVTTPPPKPLEEPPPPPPEAKEKTA